MESEESTHLSEKGNSQPAASEQSLSPGSVTVCLAGVDWKLLRVQKETLLAAMPEIAQSKPVSRSVMESVYGLIHLLDHIQDEAAETLGEQSVFEDLTELQTANHEQTATRTSATHKRYTVVGLWPDEYWDQGMRDGSFVEFTEADSPVAAAQAARLQAAPNRVVLADENDAAAVQEETADLAARIEILAVFEGYHLMDLYDPTLEK
jgi:hypothetical protein